jgi:adenylate kinase family enzyme
MAMTLWITTDEATRRLRMADRLLVIGCAGSGKSTLAQQLSNELRLPYVSMDREVFWLPGWRMRPRPEAQARLKAIVEEERWIIDGTSPGTLKLRLPRTDLVLWLRPPRRVSLYGVLSRWLKLRGTTRAEMADGCPEQMTWKFVTYVWNFERTESPEIIENLMAYGPSVPVCVLKSRAENRRLLASFGTVD